MHNAATTDLEELFASGHTAAAENVVPEKMAEQARLT